MVLSTWVRSFPLPSTVFLTLSRLLIGKAKALIYHFQFLLHPCIRLAFAECDWRLSGHFLDEHIGEAEVERTGGIEFVLADDRGFGAVFTLRRG